MTTSTLKHATFVIERTYPASIARVYAAFADPAAKAEWAACHEDAIYALDFRVGGSEYFRGGPKGGPVYTNETRYHDIVPNRRFAWSYSMHADDALISVSVNSVELFEVADGTRLVFTEQGVFFDGRDTPERREHGTGIGLDKLGAVLAAKA